MELKKTILIFTSIMVVILLCYCNSEPEPNTKPQKFYRHTVIVRYLNDKLPNDTITITSYRSSPTGSYGAISIRTWTDDGAVASVLHYYGTDKMQMPKQIASGVRSFKVIDSTPN